MTDQDGGPGYYQIDYKSKNTPYLKDGGDASEEIGAADDD